VWDPLDPESELARFDGHTGAVWGLATLAWPGLDHIVVITASEDGTARVWDPHRPEAELARLPLLGQGLAVTVAEAQQPVIATTRGFVFFDLRGGF
jgi:hypothetical protein